METSQTFIKKAIDIIEFAKSSLPNSNKDEIVELQNCVEKLKSVVNSLEKRNSSE